jgi:hypothetical protein
MPRSIMPFIVKAALAAVALALTEAAASADEY